MSEPEMSEPGFSRIWRIWRIWRKWLMFDFNDFMGDKYYMNWSGGKDSSLSMHRAMKDGIKVEALLTSVNKVHERISMHGVRRMLLEKQAASIGLPLYTIELPEQPGMDDYEKEMNASCANLKSEGFTHALFGDIFLEDLRKYREEQMKKIGFQPVFPLWKIDSRELMEEFISSGFKGIIVCINSAHLDKSFCGRLMDESFLRDLPENVDPCGENGEYHSFVFDGPIFSHPIPYTKGEIVYREYKSPSTSSNECHTTPKPSTGFYFCDLLP